MKRYMIYGILANTIFAILAAALANAILFEKVSKLNLIANLLTSISGDVTTGIAIGVIYCFIVYVVNWIIMFDIEDKFLYIFLNGAIFYCWVSFISTVFFT